MTRAAVVLAGVMLLTSSVSAHRLDEYLQATRVNLARDRVELEIDLTPGASVASAVIALIDRDRDGVITPVEAESYGRAVLGDVRLDLDGAALRPTLGRIDVPSIDEMQHGMGTINLRAAVEPSRPLSSRPKLAFHNNHHPASSVYLINALVPADADITVFGQTRDATQRSARIDYSVTARWPKYVYWPVFGLVVGGWWLVRARSTSH